MKRHCIWIILSLLLAACATQPPPTPAHSATMISEKEADADFWLAKPAAATVQSLDFEKLWRTCAETARDYHYKVDLQNYRSGLFTTQPMVSMQFFEVWRKDSGTLFDVAQNSLQTIERTLRFEVRRAEDGSFIATPKVVVWRYSQVERRITSVSEYRYIFVPSQPGNDTPEVYADREANIPQAYYYAIGRDEPMERQVARQVKDRLRD